MGAPIVTTDRILPFQALLDQLQAVCDQQSEAKDHAQDGLIEIEQALAAYAESQDVDMLLDGLAMCKDLFEAITEAL